ncbi:hypothetical protein ABB02_00357 [Clostridiaceae bacterium JG1575]|nr:hypothetical protein ABB02_00357 [Clostridiaceae bacterium JG1575]
MLAFFSRLGLQEVLVILIVALLVFGPKKLPEIGKSLGHSFNEFKRSMNGEPAKTPENPSSGNEE